MDSQQASLVESLIDDASAALTRGDLEAAEASIQKVLGLAGPAVPAKAIWVHGLIRSQQGRFGEAMPLLESLTTVPALRGFAGLYDALYSAALGAGDLAKASAAARIALGIDPSNLVLRNDFFRQMVTRAIPITADDLAGALKALDGVPLSHEFAEVYRVAALALAVNGEVDRAADLYFPLLEHLIGREERPAWYNFRFVEGTDDMAAQSQRHNEEEAEIAGDFALAAEQLALTPDDTVADIGGAGGILSRRLAQAARQVILTDLSAELAAKASRQLAHLGNVTCVQHDITAGPLEAPVDKLLMSRVTPMLTGLRRLEMALGHVFQSLKPGGRAFVTNNYDVHGARDALMEALRSPIDKYATLVIYENLLWLDPETVRQVAMRAGFGSAAILNWRKKAGHPRAFDLLLVK